MQVKTNVFTKSSITVCVVLILVLAVAYLTLPQATVMANPAFTLPPDDIADITRIVRRHATLSLDYLWGRIEQVPYALTHWRSSGIFQIEPITTETVNVMIVPAPGLRSIDYQLKKGPGGWAITLRFD